MRPLTLLGIVAIIFGAFVLIRGVAFTSDREVLDIGGIEASVEERRAIPTWAGGLALVVGIGLVVAGSRKRA